MKTIPIFFTFFTLSFILVSCTPVEREDARLMEALQPVRQQYCPDRRLVVFDIAWERLAGRLVVTGQVDDERAKEAALEAIRNAGFPDALDSVRVLPDPELGEKRFGIVAVSVGNVRSEPAQPAELATQVMMGMVVKLLKKQGGWYYVQCPDEYLGWLEGASMELVDEGGVEAWRSAPKVITTSYFAVVREHPEPRALPVSDAVAGTLMRFEGRRGMWVGVGLPLGRKGYIEQSHVEEYARWRQSRHLTPENVERTAKMFLGVPYVWGGTSPKGMDCSGYTKTVFRLNGMELLRDASQQVRMGEEVVAGDDFENLKKGDLLFFGRKATAERPERITHVAIFLEKKEFIHSPGGGYIRINSFDPNAPNYSESLLNSFVRARRVIGATTIPEVVRN